MAQVIFKQGQQQTLSGTFCGMVYRTRQGRTTAFFQAEPFLPAHPTAAQKAAYRRKCVLQAAVSLIQADIYKQGEPSVARMQQIANLYHAIYQHCDERYDEWRHRFTSDNRLAQAIAYWYITERYPLSLFDPPLSSTASSNSSKSNL